MREWCACGSAIRGRRSDVLKWRTEHHCPTRPVEDNPGQYGGNADTQINYDQTALIDGIGFRPNPTGTH